MKLRRWNEKPHSPNTVFHSTVSCSGSVGSGEDKRDKMTRLYAMINFIVCGIFVRQQVYDLAVIVFGFGLLWLIAYLKEKDES